LGAVVSQTHYHKILERIDIARQEGGIILCGGTQVEVEGEGSKGYYIAPTVIEGLPLNCRTNQEEIFGPVVTIHPFSTEEEALNLANGTPYGLSATVWTNNLSRAQRFSVELEAGIVWLNTWMMRDLRTPFGGVKDSGIGREGGWEALRFFTDTKNITFRL
jgi:aminomuconate-semialdehyde/2-hydroxymuconate-6-semialdehyde dehydrogenase